MAQVIQELTTRFTFAGNLGKLDDFNAGLGKAITALGAVAAAAGAAGGALFAFVSSTAASLDPMVQLSRETGVAMENIQTLGFAASQSGSSAEALQSSLLGLSERLGEAVNGGGEGVEVFKQLGVQIRDSTGQVRNVDAVLDDLRRNMGSLSSAERISVAGKLGIDASLVQLLSSTDEQIAGLTARARELGVVTTEQGDAAAAFNDSLTVLRYGMDAIRNSIAVGFAPQMQELVERFVDFLSANRELLENGINAVADGLIVLLDMFGRLAPFIAAAAGAFTLVALASGGFAAILAALVSPVVLIAAGIAALLLVVDDLIVAFEGGDSVIADFFENFFGIDIQPILISIVTAFDDMIDGIMKAFVPLGAAISSLFSAVTSLAEGDFEGMVDGVEGFFDGLFDYITLTFGATIGFVADLFDIAFPGIVDNVIEFFEPLVDAIGSLFSAVTALATGDFAGFVESIQGLFSGLFDFITNSWSAVLGFFGGLVDAVFPGIIGSIKDFFSEAFSWITDKIDGIVGAFKSIGDFLGIGEDAAETAVSASNSGRMLPGGAAGLTQNSSNITQDIKIDVTSSDPQEAGVQVRNQLQEQLRDAQTQFSRGGR